MAEWVCVVGGLLWLQLCVAITARSFFLLLNRASVRLMAGFKHVHASHLLSTSKISARVAINQSHTVVGKGNLFFCLSCTWCSKVFHFGVRSTCKSLYNT